MAVKSKPKTVAEYIKAAPKDAQTKLKELRDCLREVAPDAEESLKWSSPAFSYDRILFMFAAYKRHIGFYPTPAVIKAFAKELQDFKTSQATIQFPLDKPLPTALIKKIARYRVKDCQENDAKWM
jgi:uncharacterized protein YdhG (YjbR/CyaY superfamily)